MEALNHKTTEWPIQPPSLHGATPFSTSATSVATMTPRERVGCSYQSFTEMEGSPIRLPKASRSLSSISITKPQAGHSEELRVGSKKGRPRPEPPLPPPESTVLACRSLRSESTVSPLFAFEYRFSSFLRQAQMLKSQTCPL